MSKEKKITLDDSAVIRKREELHKWFEEGKKQYEQEQQKKLQSSIEYLKCPRCGHKEALGTVMKPECPECGAYRATAHEVR